MTKIKICGLFRDEDIGYINGAMPDYCGFIINFPKSHRSVSPERVRELSKSVSDGIVAVGVFVDEPVENVARLLRDGIVSIAQLHGHEDDEYIAKLRSLTYGSEIWKAFRIKSREDLLSAERSKADMVLLDNGQGTGEVFDWNVIEKFPRPFILAGGLTPENIPEAIRILHPFALDVSSGVETERRKDRNKIYAAVNAVRRSN